jgi:cytochrome c biogenesis protein
MRVAPRLAWNVFTPTLASSITILGGIGFTLMTKPESNKKSNPLWAFFCSVKLTIALLIILAVVSVIGTLLPQQQEGMHLAEKLSPTLFRVLSTLQVFDLYHSIWFRLLIGALAVNLVICSIDRFSVSLKRFRARPSPVRSKPFKDMPPERTITVRGNIEEMAARVGDALKGKYRGIRVETSEGAHFILGETGRYSYFGVYLVHLSVLLILIGGLLGSIFGFDAYVNIEEGTAIESVVLRNKRISRPLGFGVRCDKFTIDYYANGAPKEYRSELSFLEDGNIVQRGSLIVNHPITFRKVTFYQSSYGSIPGDRVLLRIAGVGKGIEDMSLDAELRKPYPLPGNEGTFQVIEANDNLMGMMGPAALISIDGEQGDKTSFWVFLNHAALRQRFPGMMEHNPRLNPSAFAPYTFYLEDLPTNYYTGLQVNRDPGVPFVWGGFFTIVIGLFATFFWSHRRVWIRISSVKGAGEVRVAGTASKNPVALERELDRLTQTIRTRLTS